MASPTSDTTSAIVLDGVSAFEFLLVVSISSIDWPLFVSNVGCWVGFDWLLVTDVGCCVGFDWLLFVTDVGTCCVGFDCSLFVDDVGCWLGLVTELIVLQFIQISSLCTSSLVSV